MKICYLANAASLHTLRWANYFAEHGWETDLVTWHSPRNGTPFHPSIRMHRILFPPHSLAICGALLETATLMGRIRPDIIHAHYLGHFGVLAGLYGRLTGFRPMVLTAWGSDVLLEAGGFKKHLVKNALERAELITCDAEHIVREMVGLGAAPDKIALIYFGTDVEKFSPRNGSEELKEKLGLAGSPTVISLRSLYPLYDVETLVRAAPLVLRQVPETKFVVAGDGEQRQYLADLASELAVADSVRFVGLIANDELPQYLNSADIYVSTSLSDAGLAASTAEAMACGLPVVITDFGDNRNWVEDGVSGFVVPLKNPEAIAGKLIYLLRNKDKRGELGRAARRVIEERNNREKEMARMGDLYNQLIERYRK